MGNWGSRGLARRSSASFVTFLMDIYCTAVENRVGSNGAGSILFNSIPFYSFIERKNKNKNKSFNLMFRLSFFLSFFLFFCRFHLNILLFVLCRNLGVQGYEVWRNPQLYMVGAQPLCTQIPGLSPGKSPLYHLPTHPFIQSFLIPLSQSQSQQVRRNCVNFIKITCRLLGEEQELE